MLFKLLNYAVFTRSHKTACCSNCLRGLEPAFSRNPDQTDSQIKRIDLAVRKLADEAYANAMLFNTHVIV